MQTIRLIGQVDECGRLVATVPDSVAPGEVEIMIIGQAKRDDDSEDTWTAGVAREWHHELADPQQDIYTLQDGVPSDESR